MPPATARLSSSSRKRDGALLRRTQHDPRVPPQPRVTGVASGWVPSGSAPLWTPWNEGPASVATRTAFTLPPAQGGPSRGVERPPGFVRGTESPNPSPRGGSREEGPRTRRKLTSLGQHSGASAVETSCATVCKLLGCCCFSPARGEQCGRGARGAGGVGGPGAGPGRCTQSSQVLGPEPRGQTRPGRAAAGARGCKCAMRARRGGRVSPLSPSSPASQSSGQTRQRAGTEAPASRNSSPARAASPPRTPRPGPKSSGAPGLGRGSRRRTRPSRSQARSERAAR